jgi:hypothetical protein
VLLVIVAATMVGGAAAAWLGLSGVAVMILAVVRAATMKPEEYRREAPVPPGGPGPGGGAGIT